MQITELNVITFCIIYIIIYYGELDENVSSVHHHGRGLKKLRCAGNHLSFSRENSINYEKSINKQEIKLDYIFIK